MNDGRDRDKATRVQTRATERDNKRERERFVVCSSTVYIVATGYLRIPELIYCAYINMELDVRVPFYMAERWMLLFSLSLSSVRDTYPFQRSLIYSTTFTSLHTIPVSIYRGKEFLSPVFHVKIHAERIANTSEGKLCQRNSVQRVRKMWLLFILDENDLQIKVSLNSHFAFAFPSVETQNCVGTEETRSSCGRRK